MKYYKCYSANFHKFLQTKGLRYLLIAKDIVTSKTFWLYEEDNKFTKAREEWHNSKP